MRPDSTPTLVEPTLLLGRWDLTRRVHDELAGISGTASGELLLRAEDDHIVWREQGTLLWNGSQLPFSRTYSLRHSDEGWSVYFADGQLFHPWLPGSWVRHPCADDLYKGLITIDGPGVWRSLWRLEGPDTEQDIATRFVRFTSPAYSNS